MKNRISCLITLGIIFFNSNIFGQINKGINEINFVGSVSNISGDKTSSTTFQFVTGFGHFIFNSVEIGGNFSLTKYEDVDAFGTVSGFISLYPQIKILNKAFTYIGGQFGVGYGSGENPNIFGVYAGTKIFISDGGAVTIQPYYLRHEFNYGGFNNFGILIGISIFF